MKINFLLQLLDSKSKKEYGKILSSTREVKQSIGNCGKDWPGGEDLRLEDLLFPKA